MTKAIRATGRVIAVVLILHTIDHEENFTIHRNVYYPAC
jgi:hypothetical protein